MRTEAWCAVALAMLPACAHAVLEPYWVGASQGLRAEDNLYRVPEGRTATRDLVSTTRLFGGVDQRMSRWQLRADANVQADRYRNETRLNNEGGGMHFRLDGETVGRLSGGLEYSGVRTLANFDTAAETLSLRLRNIETAQQLIARAQLGAVAPWLANLVYSHRDLSYSAEAFATRENRQDSLSLGGVWGPAAPRSVGLALRYTDGEYPRGIRLAAGRFAPDAFDRQDVDLTFTWAVTGASTTSARVSYTRQTYASSSQRDYSGLTGSLQWAWRATGKTSLNLSLNHDTGSESSFYGFTSSSASVTGDSSQLSTAIDLDVRHALTGKLALALGLGFDDRELRNGVGGGGVVISEERGDEHQLSANLGLRWTATRAFDTGCSWQQVRRRGTGTLTYPYRANVASCDLRMTLR